jgi:hypothetical protein
MVALKQGVASLPLSFPLLVNGLAVANVPKRAAANRIDLTIVVCGMNDAGVR